MTAKRRTCVRVRLLVPAIVAVWTMFLIASSLLAQTDAQRPRLLGIAHVAIFQSDLNSARTFYRDLLGFAEPFSLKHPDGTEWLAFIKINDQQYVELFEGTRQNSGHISHFALYTDNAARMRFYLAARGVTMVDQLHQGQTGDRFFTIKDPDGHFIEIVEYQPDSWTARAQGRFVPEGRISNRLTHVGVLVGSIGPALSFYRDILGLRETGRYGGTQGQATSIAMALPDGNDYIELVLDPAQPSPTQHKIQNHISLSSADVQQAALNLQSRSALAAYAQPITVHVGSQQRRQVDLFGPDGTRIEIMEPPPIPTVIDSRPVSGSMAPQRQ
jgi:catechol 2,3-dioxygenase-like lactoylglutathione lyase family enzyme